MDGDADPRPDGADPSLEAHGTQMASLVLRSEALQGLPPAAVPRLLAYRVVAPEAVGGRLRPLARSDRVLAALERAVDPNGDGDPLGHGQGDPARASRPASTPPGTDPVADAAPEADRVGATVVAPAGNDGPTFSRPGSVGGPGRASHGDRGGRHVGRPRRPHRRSRRAPGPRRRPPRPAAPAGAGPGRRASCRWSCCATTRACRAAAPTQQFRTPDGVSLVAGALVVVARGGAPIAETAARAAAAGRGRPRPLGRGRRRELPRHPGRLGAGAAGGRARGRARGAALARLAADRAGAARDHHAAVAPARRRSGSPRSRRPARRSTGARSPIWWRPRSTARRAWPGRAADGTAQVAPLHRHQRRGRRGGRPGAAAAHRPARPSARAGVRSLLIQAARPIARGAGHPPGRRRWPSSPPTPRCAWSRPSSRA